MFCFAWDNNDNNNYNKKNKNKNRHLNSLKRTVLGNIEQGYEDNGVGKKGKGKGMSVEGQWSKDKG